MELNLICDLSKLQFVSAHIWIPTYAPFTAFNMSRIPSGRQADVNMYLVPLVRFGHPALWNHLHGVHFVGGVVCHFVASSKATLNETRERETG